MNASIVDWLRGSKVSDSAINDSINDAVESLFTTLMRASLSVLMQGPVNIALTAAQEGVTLVSIADPTAAPTVSDAAADDPTLAAHTVDVQYTYVTASGTETLPSPITTRTVSMGFVAAVHPPTIVNDSIGWNLYARTVQSGQLVKQNDEPLEFLVTSSTYYNEPDTGFLSQTESNPPPSENTTGDNIFYIRHLEVLTSSGLMRSWNQGDIDSDMMRRLAMTVTTSSEYQNYGFDLINQRQIEIRPAMGSTLTARYFAVVKPRRMRYASSPLPFPTVPSIEFFRCYALSQLFGSIREFTAAAFWEKKAEAARGRCELALAATNRPRNQRVTRFRF